MAPYKKVESLGVLTNKFVSKQLATLCRGIDKADTGKEWPTDKTWKSSGSGDSRAVLQTLVSDLPAVLVDPLLHSTVSLLLKPETEFRYWGRHAPAPGLHVALRLLPQASTSSLELGSLFTGARLSRDTNNLCRAALVASLARSSSLTKLVLSSKASNDILEVVGKFCSLLTELHISMSELVTDSGLASLVPSVSRPYSPVEDKEAETGGTETEQSWCENPGCPRLVIIDLTKCWNVSPSGAKTLLLGLRNLRKLIYSNMKCILEGLVQEDIPMKPFERIEYFDSSEYRLITDISMETDIPENDPAKWVTGPVRLSAIPQMFPNVTILKMMLSDPEVAHLTEIPRLVHLELEFSDDPGPGLQTLLDSHPNIANFVLLFLQVGPIQASHLVSIGKNCVSLTFLRIIGFQIENGSQLKPSNKYFKSLNQLWLSFYDDTCEDSDDEENPGANVSRHTPEMIEFFLTSDVSNLKIVNIHMNVNHFLNDDYLHKLLGDCRLGRVTRLSLSGPDDLDISMEAVRWIMDTLPSVQSLSARKWKLTQKQIKILLREAQENNIDMSFD